MDESHEKPEPRPPPTYGIANVAVSVLVFYAVLGGFASQNLYNWAARLPVGKAATALRDAAERHNQRMVALGIAGPERVLEAAFLAAQASPPRAPRAYAAVAAGRPTGEGRGGRAPAGPAAPGSSAGEVPAAAGAARRGAKAAAARKPGAAPRVPPPGPAVLVIGDSIMMAVGPVIKRDVIDKLGGDAVVNARLSTGLARPDVYDWVKELRRAGAEHRYDYVVMMLGTNDSQDFVEGGQILSYGTSSWVAVYKQRLAAMMEAACKGASHGVWIGLPPMRSPAFNRKASRINTWAQQLAADYPCMAYVPLETVIGDGRGRYTSYLKIDDRLQKVRVVDGIHVTAQGGALISALVLDVIHDGRELAH